MTRYLLDVIACVSLDPHCVSPYEMLRRGRARFFLERVGAVA